MGAKTGKCAWNKEGWTEEPVLRVWDHKHGQSQQQEDNVTGADTREKTKRTSSERKIKVYLDAGGRKGSSGGMEN